MPSEKTDPRAEDLTPTRRPPRDVLGDAIDLYLRAPSHEKSEIRAFAALVDGLLDDASAIERRRIALALAPRADTPPEIARRLATDSIEIAEQMIERSPVLTSTDLVEIMRCGPAHVGCVGRRLDLAPDVAAVLIDNAVARPDSPPVVAGTRRRSDRSATIPPAPAVADAAPTSVAAPDLPPPMFRVPVRETPPAGTEAKTAAAPVTEPP
ncbi:MAG: hypothetical protein GX458_20860, partial [Phyllobacteriaceae bacterium]|nr:hypothetical protein [Phyllobacteriaceae bacterium]